jgi:hypothetical protein
MVPLDFSLQPFSGGKMHFLKFSQKNLSLAPCSHFILKLN